MQIVHDRLGRGSFAFGDFDLQSAIKGRVEFGLLMAHPAEPDEVARQVEPFAAADAALSEYMVGIKRNDTTLAVPTAFLVEAEAVHRGLVDDLHPKTSNRW